MPILLVFLFILAATCMILGQLSIALFRNGWGVLFAFIFLGAGVISGLSFTGLVIYNLAVLVQHESQE